MTAGEYKSRSAQYLQVNVVSIQEASMRVCRLAVSPHHNDAGVFL
jgi:hypothetical protein